MPDVLCPSCKEQIEPGAIRCVACEHDLVGPGGQRTVATRRDAYGDLPQPKSFPKPGECAGCDGSVIEVLDGQVVGYSLVSCDADWCYYESTPGGVV
jgi:hypothetical protein